MSNPSTPIKAGTLLDALKNMFFKSIDNIFESAVEYRKEMGVLKQVNSLKATDRKGDEHTIEIKLSPVKDQEDVFYVEVSCKTLPDLKATEIDKKALKIDKSSKEDLKKIVSNILKENRLAPVNAEDVSKENKNDYEQIGTEYDLVFYNDSQQVSDESEEGVEDYDITVRILKHKSKEKYIMQVEGDEQLPVKFKETVKPSLVKFEPMFLTWQSDNSLGIEDDYKQEYDELLAYLKGDEVESSTSIVRFQKVVANGHTDVNLISIRGSLNEDTLVGILNASDELFDEIPEGESDYAVTETEDGWEVESCK